MKTLGSEERRFSDLEDSRLSSQVLLSGTFPGDVGCSACPVLSGCAQAHSGHIVCREFARHGRGLGAIRQRFRVMLATSWRAIWPVRSESQSKRMGSAARPSRCRRYFRLLEFEKTMGSEERRFSDLEDSRSSFPVFVSGTSPGTLRVPAFPLHSGCAQAHSGHIVCRECARHGRSLGAIWQRFRAVLATCWKTIWSEYC